MVSRSPRPRGRSHCGGIRRRRGIDRDSHSLRDRQLRLQHGLSLVWNCPRRHRIHARFVAAWAGAKRDGRGANAESHAIDRSFSPKEVLLSPVFWLLYIMFVMVSASGLMATAQIAPIASDFKVGDQIVFWGATTLTAALIIDNLANGAARPLFGWISDNIGRERTMAIAFGLGGISYWLLGALGTAPWAFVLFAA